MLTWLPLIKLNVASIFPNILDVNLCDLDVLPILVWWQDIDMSVTFRYPNLNILENQFSIHIIHKWRTHETLVRLLRGTANTIYESLRISSRRIWVMLDHPELLFYFSNKFFIKCILGFHEMGILASASLSSGSNSLIMVAFWV